jgi:monoamine oxidase
MRPQYDTLIIGAGVAGLAAGRMLAAAGRRVAILESRERVGGRIFTRWVDEPGSAGDLPIELGAEFIHGLPEETWSLVREAQIAPYELKGSRLTMAGRLETQDQGQNSVDVLRELKTWARTGSGLRDMTFAQYLGLAQIDALQAEAAAAYVESFNAADRDVIGIAALAKQQSAEDAHQGDRIFRIQEGYETIPHLLAAGIANSGCPVFLNQKVERVVWNPGSVAVSGTDDQRRKFTLEGRRAIVTLPLGVLQAGTVDFEPIPAEVMSHAGRMRMGAVLRVILVFRSRFWCEDAWAGGAGKLKKELRRLSFLFTPRQVPATWWTPMPHRAPMLTGWIGGPGASRILETLSASDPYALLRECLSVLSKTFGVPETELGRLLVSWHWHDWSADEFARGAYSYVPAGAIDAPDNMTLPVQRTLYFAGEHTDTVGDWGTVHGALRSGLRAAEQVLGDFTFQ